MKGKVYVLVLVWMAFLAQVVVNINLEGDKNLVTAFRVTESTPLFCEMNLYGNLGSMTLSNEEGKELLVAFARQMGIEDYEFHEDEEPACHYLHLRAKKEEEQIQISLVTVPVPDEEIPDNYVLLKVSKPESIDKALVEVNDLKQFFGGLCDRVNTNVYVKSQKSGTLSKDEMEAMAKDFFLKMGAAEVFGIREDELYTIYGYSDRFEENVKQGEDLVNVNIAFSYDEEEDITYIHMGIPFVNRSF